VIPERREIVRLLALHDVPRHIVDHSVMVCRVALAIGNTLAGRGLDVDLALIEASALLHDLCKMECIRSGLDHASRGEEVLRRYGYPRVARVVGQHVSLRSSTLDEAMVVNYADKRVMHTRIVPLETRFADLMERYGTDETRRLRIQKHKVACLAIEKTIADACAWGPRDLARLRPVPFDEALDGGQGLG